MTARIRPAGLALSIALALTWLGGQAAGAQQNPFLGRWNLTGFGENSANVYWLEIADEGGQLTGAFLNRGGSPNKLAAVRIENGELVFQGAPRRAGPGPEGRARMHSDRLAGTIRNGAATVEFVGVRPPKWPPADASAPHTFGTPVELFNGTSLDAFELVRKEFPWTIVDGLATNTLPGSNLISTQKFQDYKIHAEYKLDNGSHSGIYWRGRYEMQVLGDMGRPVDQISHMAVYGRIAPLVNASKPDNEWNTMDGIIVGNKITVTLNGQKVHDNTTLDAITGNALDANELEPGPIMLVGNDGKIWYRRVTVTPVTDTRR